MSIKIQINNIAAFCNPVAALTNCISNLTSTYVEGRLARMHEQRRNDAILLKNFEADMSRFNEVIKGRAEPIGEIVISVQTQAAMQRAKKQS